MQCATCGHPDNEVVDVRKNPGNIWRRRKCRKCGATWTTVESPNPSDAAILAVVDGLKDAAREITDAMSTLKSIRTRGGVG